MGLLSAMLAMLLPPLLSAMLVMLDMLLLLLPLLLLPQLLPNLQSLKSPLEMATTNTFAIQKRNIGLCNPKRPFTCSMFKLFLFRRLIFSEFLWFSHADPSNFDPGETRKTQFGYAQF